MAGFVSRGGSSFYNPPWGREILVSMVALGKKVEQEKGGQEVREIGAVPEAYPVSFSSKHSACQCAWGFHFLSTNKFHRGHW